HKHKLLHAERRPFHDPETDFEGENDYELFECLGCGAINFRHTSWDSATEEAIVYYPPQVARRKPRWLSDLRRGATSRSAVVPLFDEIYVAVQSGSCRLAGMGVRALIEHVMIEKVGDNGSFGTNLKAFKEAGYLGLK